jgi:hypothetical protein
MIRIAPPEAACRILAATRLLCFVLAWLAAGPAGRQICCDGLSEASKPRFITQKLLLLQYFCTNCATYAIFALRFLLIFNLVLNNKHLI